MYFTIYLCKRCKICKIAVLSILGAVFLLQGFACFADFLQICFDFRKHFRFI